MADEILSSGTTEGSDVSTVPANSTFADAADALDPNAATSETDGTTDADEAADPKKLLDTVRGYKGTVTQQARELKELKAKMAELETVSKEAAAARAELQRLQSEQASTVARNQAQVQIQANVEAAVADYARDMELRGVFAVIDDETKAVMLDRYRKAELKAEIQRYETENRDTRLNETAREKAARERTEQSIAARDKVVAREAVKLTKQLKAVGVERQVEPGEIISLLKKAVTDPNALDELQDVSEAFFDKAIDDAKKAARKAGIAERDANGVDVFERGGTPSLSPQTILDRWADGNDPTITYAMAKAAEKALARR